MIDDKLKQTVIDLYQKEGTSIQAIARDHRLSVEEVLTIIGQTDVLTIEGAGDMIGSDEVDDGTEIITSKKFKQEFTIN